MWHGWKLVGASRFERPTTRTPSEYATGLRHAPTCLIVLCCDAHCRLAAWSIATVRHRHSSRMGVQNFQDRLQIAAQFLRQFLGLDPLTRDSAATRPIPLYALERVAFLVQHALDFQYRLHIFAHVQT